MVALVEARMLVLMEIGVVVIVAVVMVVMVVVVLEGSGFAISQL